MSLLSINIYVKIISIIAGAYYVKHLKTPYRLVLYLMAIALVCECYGYYIAHYLKHYNAWLFNLYMLIEVWMMVGAGLYLISNLIVKKVFFVALLCNSFFWLATILSNSIYNFANIPMITGCLLMTAVYMYVLISNGIFNRQNVLGQPIFWLSISIILYAACDIPFMAMHAYLHKHAPILGQQLQNINNTLAALRYPLAGISFVLLGRKRKAISI